MSTKEKYENVHDTRLQENMKYYKLFKVKTIGSIIPPLKIQRTSPSREYTDKSLMTRVKKQRDSSKLKCPRGSSVRNSYAGTRGGNEEVAIIEARRPLYGSVVRAHSYIGAGFWAWRNRPKDHNSGLWGDATASWG